MNRLSAERRGQIIASLIDGMSLRSVSGALGVARNTINKLLCDLGNACASYQQAALTRLPCSAIEVGEIWTRRNAKRESEPDESKGSVDDMWTWVAIDADTRLIPSWLVGAHTAIDGYAFLRDLESRLRNARIHFTVDGIEYLFTIVDGVSVDDISLAVLSGIYGCGEPDTPEFAQVPPIDISAIASDPVSTRFTRPASEISKKVESHAASVSLHIMNYNFARPHPTLGKRITPAMAAGTADHAWTVWEIAGLLD